MSKEGKVIAIKPCAWCGKDVEIRHKERLNHKNIFCSHRCEGNYNIANNPNYVRCVNCGKLVYKKPSEIKKSKTGLLCCSFKCMGEIRKILYSGEDNPNFGNGGIKSPLHKNNERITSLGYKLIALEEPHPFAISGFWIKEHRYLAEKYLMTDEQSIEIDGKKYLSPMFDVHHKDFNRLNNNLDNLLILPRSEHMKLHWKLKRKEELAS